MYASVEIKTKVAENRIAAAECVRFRNGSYFVCTVGSALWYEAIPSEHRGQLLHQALVLNVKYVLFVLARSRSIIYVAVVKVTPQQLRLYHESLDQYVHLLQWAHQGTLPPTELPQELRQMAISHTPLWKAVKKKVNANGPMLPVLKFKSAIASEYCANKGGIDSGSQVVDTLYNHLQKFSLAQKIIATHTAPGSNERMHRLPDPARIRTAARRLARAYSVSPHLRNVEFRDVIQQTRAGAHSCGTRTLFCT